MNKRKLFRALYSLFGLAALACATTPCMGQPSQIAQVAPVVAPAAASPSPTMYPSPIATARSINAYVYIVSDDASVIADAQKQASQAGNPSPSPSPSASASPAVAAPKAAGGKGAVAAAAGKGAGDAAPAASPSPSPSPSPGAGSSDVTGAVLGSISTLNSELQSDLIAQFKRRTIPVVTQNQFDDYCAHGSDAYALHWSIIDPTLGLDQSWQLFGYTTSTFEIYWYVTTCQPLQKVLLSPVDKANESIYHTSKGQNFQVRAPTDFLASVFGLLALIHPAGRAIVSISFTGGISAVSGTLNTILNSAYSSHDLVGLTANKVAWEVANDYCSGPTAPQTCKRVRRP